MDKKTLYDELGNVESEMTSMVQRITEMKKAVDELTEQNVTLEIENRHLRERLVELDGQEGEVVAEAQALSKSRMNLEKIYEDGFHVCNFSYGTRRENDEPCAFCLDVIYGDRK
ncbi:DNA replication initiation control protein YabA [Vagococcus coleopterorum]|uniref:Replication initiation control protein YabA n=1 Tax=Vagococcus coleopterorum TaxID=2714946 RepID=A0A6G8AN16_9ENTE|nr:DNA replication initiation control protein YabA [Vagococcus coleopterorum]QIL46359.1 DNA replication initiation control protein YabA [Vagococcus coleopterorum]